MFRTTSQFDYQSIIEACGIQDVNIKKALDEKSETITKFHKQFKSLKRLSKERHEKNENLSKLRLMLNKNLQKLYRMCSKMSTLNKAHKIVQDEISQLNIKLQQKSTEFVQKMMNMDTELKILYSQFEGETLTNVLSGLNTELLSVQDREVQLQRTDEQLNQYVNDYSKYEKPTILKSIISDDVNEHKKLEEIEKKLTNKKRNIQFLVGEYNKKTEWLQKFA